MRACCFACVLLAWPSFAGEESDPPMLWISALEGKAELAPGVVVPATGFACRGCHGRDGSGGGEGALRAPDIGRAALTARGYDAAAFARVVEEGHAPDGTALARGMPRYSLSPEALSSLWDATEALEAARRRGVSPDRVRLGLLHDPARRGAAGVVRAYREAAEAGLPLAWGREIELFSLSMEAPHDLHGAEIFAVIGPFPGDAAQIPRFAAAMIPALHGFLPMEDGEYWVIPLMLDATEELLALVQQAKTLGLRRIALSDGPAARVRAAEQALTRNGLTPAERGDAEAILVLEEGSKLPVGIVALVPRDLARAGTALADWPDRLVLHPLPVLEGSGDPLRAYASASLAQIVRALQQSGPDPTRQAFVRALHEVRREALGLPR